MTAKPFCDGPFKVIKSTRWIVGKDKHGDDCHILDQRGWGYLIGEGRAALGLDTATASQMQDEMQQWVVNALNAAWNTRADLHDEIRAQPAECETRLRKVVEALWEIRLEYDPSDDSLNSRTMYDIACDVLAEIEKGGV